MQNGRNHWNYKAFRHLAGASALALMIAVSPAKSADPAASLFDAIRANDLERVKQLIETGTDPRQRNAAGVSAPQAAVRLGHHVIAHFLLSQPRPEKPDLAPPPPSLETAEKPAEENLLPPAVEAEPETLPPLTGGDTQDRVDFSRKVETPPDPLADLAAQPAQTPVDAPEPPAAAPPAETEGNLEKEMLEVAADPVPETATKRAETTARSSDASPAGPEKGFLARAGDWISGLFGGKEDADEKPELAEKAPAPTSEPEQAGEQSVPAPMALTPPQLDAAPEISAPGSPSEPAAETDLANILSNEPATPPQKDVVGVPADVDQAAASGNPVLQPVNPDLPEADLPRAIADAPVPDDPLGRALAVPDEGGPPVTPQPVSDPLADLALLDQPAPAKPKTGSGEPASAPQPVADLTKMAPEERLAWLDQLLKRTVDRDGGKALADGREEALGHLRRQAERKQAEAERMAAAARPPERGQLPARAKDGGRAAPDTGEPDLSIVEGPKPGTPKSRRLKIPLPPPDPDGRKAPSRDPWFRDVSPDEPDVRAAHRARRAPAPERGEAPKATPVVPQLTDSNPVPPPPRGTVPGAKVATNLPEPPPIKETPANPQSATTPVTVNPSPAPGGADGDRLDDALADLVQEFSGNDEKPKDDPLAALLGDDKPAPDAAASPSAPSDDPLAALLSDDQPAPNAAASPPAPSDDPLAALLGDDQPAPNAAASPSAPSDDPLAALLGDDKPASSAPAAPSDPLTDALNDLAGDLNSPAGESGSQGQDVARAEPAEPPATPDEILKVLPPGSQVKLDQEGRPLLPNLWTDPVVLPGQQPPTRDLALAYVTPAGFRAKLDHGEANALLGDLPPGTNSTAAWPVTKIQMADGKTVQPPSAQQGGAVPSLSGRGAVLENVTLSVGTGTSLYNLFIPKDAKGGDGRAPECVEKQGGRTQVCITELAWPAFIEPKFLVSTVLYTGTGAIVRFDDGVPTRLQAVYQAEAFDELADWMVRRFGPPSSAVNRSVAPFGQARRDNPTMIWQALDRVTQKPVMLELRKYDDTRDGFPDIRYGAIMLYREGAPAIFPNVSVHELMRLKRTG